MYEKDGEKYFIVDSHMHYWDATPANWVPGAEQYAKGWIECFHAYQSLGPKETHWSIEKFEGYTEDDLMKDVFEDFIAEAVNNKFPLKDVFKTERVLCIDQCGIQFPIAAATAENEAADPLCGRNSQPTTFGSTGNAMIRT